MDIKAIKEALQDHPHIKKVWVCENGYTTVKRSNAIEVDLSVVSEVESTQENEEKKEELPVKPKKKK